jgi:hypothetical protein
MVYLLAVVREFIEPAICRSALDRLLRRRCVNRLPELEAASTPIKTFKAYESGYNIHLGVKVPAANAGRGRAALCLRGHVRCVGFKSLRLVNASVRFLRPVWRIECRRWVGNVSARA